MAQLFHPSANALSKVSIVLLLILIGGSSWVAYELYHSAYFNGQDVVQSQPVMFSHAHHVGGLGIDCRYCHTSVERSSTAGIPPTHTCMTCHSQVWTEAPILEPVRNSYRTDQPLEWIRVHDLPDFVYFNHSIHVKQGIGCDTCHGQVDRMPLIRQAATLYMQWCLDCHRNPEQYVRPREEVFNMNWQPPENRMELGRQLVEEYNIQAPDYCSTCHR